MELFWLTYFLRADAFDIYCHRNGSIMRLRLLPQNGVAMLELTVICGRLVAVGAFLATVASTYSPAQMQEFPNRREGTTVHVDALEDFTLLAVHRNFESFPRNSNLNVRFFLPKLPDNPNKDVVVEAVELQDSVHYSMRSKSAPSKEGTWNVFGQWPTKDVIDRLDIDAGNVGVLAEYRVGNKLPVCLPVDVYQDAKQPAKPAYTFHFITGQDLQSLDISVTNKAGAQVNLPKPKLMCNKSFNPNCKLYAAGSTQAFDLDMSSLAEGEYHLKLTGHVPGNSTPTSLEIVLYHHP